MPHLGGSQLLHETSLGLLDAFRSARARRRSWPSQKSAVASAIVSITCSGSNRLHEKSHRAELLRGDDHIGSSVRAAEHEWPVDLGREGNLRTGRIVDAEQRRVTTGLMDERR